MVPPTVDEVAAVRDALDERWRVVLVTLAGSGLRIGELLGVAVSDVDFLRRTIRVDRQRLQSGELDPVKSKASRRNVPVGEIVLASLAAHLAGHPSDSDLFADEFGQPLTLIRCPVSIGQSGSSV